jgi:hypothetical protein
MTDDVDTMTDQANMARLRDSADLKYRMYLLFPLQNKNNAKVHHLTRKAVYTNLPEWHCPKRPDHPKKVWAQDLSDRHAEIRATWSCVAKITDP